jgi:hypothetical protein
VNIRPKQFVAACDFSHGPHQFAAGDPIPEGRVLGRLLEFGDAFVVEANRGKAAPGKESADG